MSTHFHISPIQLWSVKTVRESINGDEVPSALKTPTPSNDWNWDWDMGPNVLSYWTILIRRNQTWITFFKRIKLGDENCLRWEDQNVKVRTWIGYDDLVKVPWHEGVRAWLPSTVKALISCSRTRDKRRTRLLVKSPSWKTFPYSFAHSRVESATRKT